MAVRVEWFDDEKTILHHIYEGDVSLEDYYQVIDENYRMAITQEHTVHAVMNRTAMTSNPASLTAMMRNAERRLPPNQGMRIVIGGRMLTKMIVNNIGKVVAPNLTKDVYFVDTLEEAIELIRQQTSV